MQHAACLLPVYDDQNGIVCLLLKGPCSGPGLGPGRVVMQSTWEVLVEVGIFIVAVIW